MTGDAAVVIGAGIVGVTSALELQRRGFSVTLIDRGPPGGETTYGNAGVLSDASVIPVNNPELPLKLPKLLFAPNIALKVNWGFVLSRLPWALRFLSFSTTRHLYHAGWALRRLQVASIKLHKALIAEAGVGALLRQSGWLKLYRSERAFAASARERAFLGELGVSFSIVSAAEIRTLEPALKADFYKGVLLTETCSVSSPQQLTAAYFRLFRESGGRFLEAAAKHLQPDEQKKWRLDLTTGESLHADHVVVAAGPWSAELLKPLGYTIPMAWERGYHRHFQPLGPHPLTRPVYDVEGGFVITPQAEGVRVLSGVELTYRDAAPDYEQINAAVARAQNIIDLGPEVGKPWLGRRPTLADSLPMVGASPKHPGLWFNFGHQHVGVSTSAGCAQILADQMEGKPPLPDHLAFRPGRFRL